MSPDSENVKMWKDTRFGRGLLMNNNSLISSASSPHSENEKKVKRH